MTKILSEHEKKAWRAMCAMAGVDSGLGEEKIPQCAFCGDVEFLAYDGFLQAHKCLNCAQKILPEEEVCDPVNHPSHYNSHPSGVECVQIARHENFNRGNALKYWWRAGLKSDNPVEDYRKAIWYLEDEIKRIEGGIVE